MFLLLGVYVFLLVCIYCLWFLFLYVFYIYFFCSLCFCLFSVCVLVFVFVLCLFLLFLFVFCLFVLRSSEDGVTIYFLFVCFAEERRLVRPKSQQTTEQYHQNQNPYSLDRDFLNDNNNNSNNNNNNVVDHVTT